MPLTMDEITKSECLRQIFQRLSGLGVVFPDSYTVIDTETTGLSPAEDYITQVGWCVVENRIPVLRDELILDWTRSVGVNQDWLKQRLDSTRFQLEKGGRKQHTDYGRMAREGLPPHDVLTGYWELLDALRVSNGYLLTHGGYHFDMPMLRSHFREFLQRDYDVDLVHMMDSGLLEKAAQAGLMPWEGDRLVDFFKRVSGLRLKGVYWSLDGHCVSAYDLAQKHGLDLSQAHGAGFDCYLSHLVFEEQRRLASYY